ncbi:coenzyme F420-reducing hydrogenase, FrhD protein [Methanosphaera sp. ISO3-F5]|uniref:coenzyme F420-reducing hydrogenase, FrhD protein n=1 Tax=Methanosphaera sp. ISO3-F5 TaxID=1452353 RepID=UPI002B263CFF|nr:coenzyme F420-reducing hydrogenase, FrhD protein [Methanosphaera sp. ISO3-F5]WQH64385.1 coenzyme F420-reducing hydrogenase, FrhD protein [Methanosphaera sp. ISO3-F5]
MSYNHENLIVGCGNILYGDDGFGPEVIKHIKENNITFNGDTCVIDGATSAPHYIFTLPQEKWKNIIIVDIASLNTTPGTIKTLNLDQVHEEERYMDVHGLSATYPLHDLKDKINIKIIAIQPENVPDEMEIGLSNTLTEKIPQTIDIIHEVLDSMLQE